MLARALRWGRREFWAFKAGQTPEASLLKPMTNHSRHEIIVVDRLQVIISPVTCASLWPFVSLAPTTLRYFHFKVQV